MVSEKDLKIIRELNFAYEKIATLHKKIAQMTEDCLLLEALRQCGVDNWDGYGYALELRDSWANEGR